ncbi:hypothetical protein FQN60_014242, partial [Etheostoma spectabile]
MRASVWSPLVTSSYGFSHSSPALCPLSFFFSSTIACLSYRACTRTRVHVGPVGWELGYITVMSSRRYDSRTTIFSPEGRLYQVEYAMEAIGHAGTCLGILANDGVLLAAERRNIHKLLDEVFFSEKIYKLNEDMACSVAGITSDANVLTNELRLIAQRYLLQYQEPIPCEQLVTALCDIKQAYTQFGVLKVKEVDELIKKHEAEEAKAEKDKKEKEQKEKD